MGYDDVLEVIMPMEDEDACDEDYQFSSFGQNYRNPNSQGTLITQTANFPNEYDDEKYECFSGYSDRMHSWDAKAYKKACDIAGGGGQAWKQTLHELSDAKLKRFAKVGLNLKVTPKHVRVLYYYNVSSGYDCPVVIAVYKKQG